MKRVITKYIILVISILTASLLTEFIVKHVSKYYHDRTYLSVAMSMAITVVVFVPLFGFMGKLINRFSKEYVNHSKRISKNSMTGLLIGTLLALATLFIFFAYVRHGINVWNDFKGLF